MAKTQELCRSISRVTGSGFGASLAICSSLPSRYVETDIIGHCAAAVAPRSVADSAGSTGFSLDLTRGRLP